MQHSARCRPRTIPRQITLIFLPVLCCHYNFKAAEWWWPPPIQRERHGRGCLASAIFFLFFLSSLFFSPFSLSDPSAFQGRAIKQRLQSDFSWRSTLFFHKIFPTRGFSKGDVVGKKRISRVHLKRIYLHRRRNYRKFIIEWINRVLNFLFERSSLFGTRVDRGQFSIVFEKIFSKSSSTTRFQKSLPRCTTAQNDGVAFLDHSLGRRFSSPCMEQGREAFPLISPSSSVSLKRL